MFDWFTEAASGLSENPLLQGLLAALSTFVLEDPTTIGCGLLVADQRMAFATALIGVTLGIALGDVGLYGIGRGIGPSVARYRLVSTERLDRAARWFQRNLVLALILSRFVPGMRLPTYVAAGVLRAPALKFMGVAIAASLVWTFLLLQLTLAVGQRVLPWLGRVRWPVALVALLLMVWGQRRLARRFDEMTSDRTEDSPVASRFEFWPPWLFYIPVALYYPWLALRHRGLLLPTAANPSIYAGGLIGESKSAILDLVAPQERRWVAPYTTFVRPDTIDAVTLRHARAAIEGAGLCYPLVAKPDIGQRGAGVQLVRNDVDLTRYLEGFPRGERIVLQRLAYDGEPPSGVHEAGVLYWRMPGSDEGQIFSITLKSRPCLVGDGRSTLRELIENDPRARQISRVYFERHADALDGVPTEGTSVPLVFAGNHCQGAVFRDGTSLATPRLLDRIHGIAAGMPEFWFGRFDVCFDDLDAFLRGEEMCIVEINGAGAEATHIWDASLGLGEAYRVLFRQFGLLFAIGAANRRRGYRPLGAAAFLGDAWGYRRLSGTYPATH